MAENEKSVTNIGTDVTIAIVILIIALAILGTYLRGIVDMYQSILNLIYDRNWGTIYTTLAVIFAFIDVALIVFVVWVLRRHAKLLRESPEEQQLVIHTVPLEDEVSATWKEIANLANSPNPSEWNMAIIRADGLLDTILKDRGYEGDTMADRLKIVDPSKLPSMDRVWSAHRLRNMIVHGPAIEHTKETISHAIKSFELALRELGVLK